jgi:hypothetical protein
MRKAFAEFAKQSRQEHEHDAEDDEEAGEGDLVPEPGTERHEHAMGLLRCPDILERAAQDMERLGHVGEQTAKKLLFVCAVSARAGLPIQPSIHAESSAGKNHMANTALSLLPPEMVIERTAVSAKALFRTEESLSGRVLYLQEVVGSEDADFPIRVLQTAQRLEYEVTEKMPNGSFKTVVYSKEGPVVVVQTTTAIRLFHENDTRVFPIHLDESPEQTRRIVEHAKLLAATGAPQEEREAILGVWHDAIRLLEPAEVIVPFAERIEVPIHRVRVRRDIHRILAVIQVVAWLNQHNRVRDERDHILATVEDFRIATELIADPLRSAWKSLTPAEEAVMGAIESLTEAQKKNGFYRRDLTVEGYETRQVQVILKALTETGYLDCERKGGPVGHKFTLSRNPEHKGLGVYLHPAREEGEDGPEGADTDSQGAPGLSCQEDDEEDEGARESRDIARNDDRAIENHDLQVEEADALSRGGEPEEDFLDGESDEEEDEEDYLGELTELGWHRVLTTFDTGSASGNDLPYAKDPVVQELRYRVPIYRGKQTRWWDVGNTTPWVGTAEDVFELRPKGKSDEELRSLGWPATQEEMEERLGRVITFLQQRPHNFYDPGYAQWFFEQHIEMPKDREKWCKEASLHVELWRNEQTSEELLALVALQKNWSVPDGEIERAVLWRVKGWDQEQDFDLSELFFKDLSKDDG